MRKQLNARFGLYLFLSLAVLGTATHLLHAYQVRRNADVLLIQAEHSEQQGRIDLAVGHLGRYLGMRPNDTEALVKYGQLMADARFAKSPQVKYGAVLV